LLARRFFALIYLTVSILLAAALVAEHSSTPGKREAGRVSASLSPVKMQPTPQFISKLLPHLPISFEENRGQFDSRVKFLSRGAGYGLFLSSGQATILHKGRAHLTDGGDASSVVAAMSGSEVQIKSITQLTWLGANPNSQPRGNGRQGGESNYLIGKDPSKWRRHVQHYDRVRLHELYPGIDLVYHGAQQQVELDYVIAPHANPREIQVGISGPSIVSINESAQLSISSAGDELLLLPPSAYQERNGRRENVPARYVLAASHQVGFELGAYDRSLPLIIDPVLTFAASFGASSNSSIISDVALDSMGNIYVTGTTCDTNYPTTFGVFQPSGGSNLSNACYDAIVTKLNPTASELLYSTYIGGQTWDDFAVHLLVDGAGEATVAGTTASSDFPTTSGAYQTTLKSGTCDYSPNLSNNLPCTDTFLFKLSADGSSLVYSTLFGGERGDLAMGLAQDSMGNTYISGLTDSKLLPVSSTSYSKTYNGASTCQGGTLPCFNGFIAKLSADGTQLLASTYLGGTDNDNAAQVALDTSGNVYVTGTADSVGFPTTPGAFQTVHAGPIHNGDAYLAKFDSNLQTLQYSTFFGGTGEDISVNLRVDSAGAAYITGSTLSSDLQTTAGAYQTKYGGAPAGTTLCFQSLDLSILQQPTCGDVFLAKIDPSKTGAAQLVFSTYLGGSANDFAYSLALDSQKNVWLIGDTNSTDFPFTSDAYYTSIPGAVSMFLSEIKSDGTQLLFSTPLSQLLSSGMLGLGITIDTNNNVYVVGEGAVSPTPGTYSTGTNLFVMEFSPATARPGVQLSATSMDFPTLTTPVGATSSPMSVTLTNNGAATLHLAVSLLPGTVANPVPFSEYDNCGTTLAASASCTINALYQPTTASGNFDGGTIRILDDAPGAPHTIALSGLTGTITSASFVPPTLTFNGQAPGTVSAAQSSGLNNPAPNGNTLLPVTTGLPVVSGPNESEFAVNVGNAGNCPVASHFCGLSVTFNPASGDATGTRTATVSVPTEAANSPQTLMLVGNVSSAPYAVFSPPSITPVRVGLTLNTTVLVKNTGGGTLTVTGVTASGANAADFVLSNTNCSGYPAFSLASQASCLLNLAFKPSAHGTETATFTLVDNEVAPAASVTFTGYGMDATGPALQLLLNPTPVNGQVLFPDTVVNTSSGLVTATVTISNTGNASASVTSATLPGGDFTQTNTCQGPIAGPGSCTYTVTFTPTQAGPRTGTLTIVTNAPGGQTFTVNFAGNGVLIPSATLTPASINFGSQAVGTTSAAQLGTVTNSGGAPLTLSNVTLTGPFTMTPTTCGATVAANSSCTYTFKFAPTVAGPASGTLTAATNAAGGSLAVGLNGTGVTGAVPQAQPASLTFGSQSINTKSAAQAATFSNAGSTAFTIAGIRASENFSETNNCPTSLGAGVSCTINVSFAPTADTFTGGNAMTGGNVFVTIGAPGSPFSIPLIGAATPSTGAATNLAIASSQNPSTVGQSVTFTATVSAVTGSVLPTGTVTFFRGGGATQLDTPVTLNAQGKATLTTSTLPQGFNSITIDYSGDATFAPVGSSGFVQNVNAATTAATTTTLASSLNPSTVGQSVTFTATVASQTAGTVTGTVTFLDGATTLGTGSVSGGIATFATTSLTQATHNVTARYGGDSNFTSSTSSVLAQVVNAAVTATTSTVVASSANPSVVGQSVTFTATVTSLTAGTITGTVTFFDGATQIGSPATLSGSSGSVLTSTLIQASHSITAKYSGDSNYAASTSLAVTQTVNKAATTATVISSSNPSASGQTVTFTATVTATAPGAGTPTGTVTFLDGATQIGTGALTAGVATLQTSTLAVGSHTITAQYGGDTNFNGSTPSPALTQTVNAAAQSFTLSAPSTGTLQVVAGQNAAPFTFTVSPQNNSTQMVTFSCSGLPVKASCMFSQASVTLDGTHTSAPVSVTIATTADTLVTPSLRFLPPANWTNLLRLFVFGLLALSIVLFRAHRRKIGWVVNACLLFAVLTSLLACASSNNSTTTYNGTPPGTFSVTVTGVGNPGSTLASTPSAVTLTVTSH
jgi:Big-like domain-containing protein/ASPM-SPD-2-Hydin domain-containing protein/beta-propeller repeat-containing protein